MSELANEQGLAPWIEDDYDVEGEWRNPSWWRGRGEVSALVSKCMQNDLSVTNGRP